MTQRTERIDELLRQEITSLLTKEVADPDIGFATVTEVETSPDLRHARVWVSVIGQPKDRATTLRGLERAMPFVRRELGRRLRLRRIPEFSVKLDDSIERGSRVMHLISELEAGVTPGELPEGESLPTPAVRMHHEGDAADGAEAADGTSGVAADLEALFLSELAGADSSAAPGTPGRRGAAGRPRDGAQPGGSRGGPKGVRAAGSRGAADGGSRTGGRPKDRGGSAGGSRPSKPSGRGRKADGGGTGA